MQFEFDPGESKCNLQKRGIDFKAVLHLEFAKKIVRFSWTISLNLMTLFEIGPQEIIISDKRSRFFLRLI